jgi:hypothetical protein
VELINYFFINEEILHAEANSQIKIEQEKLVLPEIVSRINMKEIIFDQE